MAGTEEFSKMGLLPRPMGLCWGDGVVQGCCLAGKSGSFFHVDTLDIQCLCF